MGFNNVSGESHNNWLDQVSTNKNVNPPQEFPKKQEKCASLTSPDQLFCTPDNKPKPVKFDQIFNNFVGGPDPKEAIFKIRNDWPNRNHTVLLIEFQNKVDKMDLAGARHAQSILLEMMSNPTNIDDDLLFTLLKSVNKKIDHDLKDPAIPDFMKLDRSKIVGYD